METVTLLERFTILTCTEKHVWNHLCKWSWLSICHVWVYTVAENVLLHKFAWNYTLKVHVNIFDGNIFEFPVTLEDMERNMDAGKYNI